MKKKFRKNKHTPRKGRKKHFYFNTDVNDNNNDNSK